MYDTILVLKLGLGKLEDRNSGTKFRNRASSACMEILHAYCSRLLILLI